jgi:hypothetical protein
MATDDAPTSIPNRFEQRFEIILAVLLGLAAIATAYAAYQTNLKDGDTLAGYQEGVRLADSASQKYLEANANRTEDQSIFLAVQTIQLDQGEEVAKELLDRLGSEELQKAYEAWDPENENTPLENDVYALPAFTEAEDLESNASNEFARAKDADKRGDRFSLVTVILATALFLYGVSAVAKARNVRLATATMGFATFCISLVLFIGA